MIRLWGIQQPPLPQLPNGEGRWNRILHLAQANSLKLNQRILRGYGGGESWDWKVKKIPPISNLVQKWELGVQKTEPENKVSTLNQTVPAQKQAVSIESGH